jgi:hypothetical protein
VKRQSRKTEHSAQMSQQCAVRFGHQLRASFVAESPGKDAHGVWFGEQLVAKFPGHPWNLSLHPSQASSESHLVHKPVPHVS